jgi:hypothetical protein
MKLRLAIAIVALAATPLACAAETPPDSAGHAGGEATDQPTRPWEGTGAVGEDLAIELGLERLPDGMLVGGPDATCGMISEVQDGSGVYCLDSVLPSRDDPTYLALRWEIVQRLRGHIPSDAEIEAYEECCGGPASIAGS